MFPCVQITSISLSSEKFFVTRQKYLTDKRQLGFKNGIAVTVFIVFINLLRSVIKQRIKKEEQLLKKNRKPKNQNRVFDLCNL